MSGETWRFVKFGLVVTGDGERDCLTDLFRPIMATGKCNFSVILQTGQRNPFSEKKALEYRLKGKLIPNKDENIVLQIRRWVSEDEAHSAIWLDDLESAQRPNAAAKYQRLRTAFDTMVSQVPLLKRRFAVHFLVNMLEAYYFADVAALNILNIQSDPSRPPANFSLSNHDGDCENLRHPKNELKRMAWDLASGCSFDEKAHAAPVLQCLDVDRVLGNPRTCRALRTLVAWCWETLGEERTERFQLRDGAYWNVTAGQLRHRPTNTGPLGEEEQYRSA